VKRSYRLSQQNMLPQAGWFYQITTSRFGKKKNILSSLCASSEAGGES
jgi:hypothetical protein